MKEYNIEVTMRVQITVEARNLSDAKEKAIELAEGCINHTQTPSLCIDATGVKVQGVLSIWRGRDIRKE